MRDAVGNVLESRGRRGGPSRRRALVASLLLHGSAVAAVLVAPLLQADEPDTLQFSGPVIIVPAAALGVREPVAPARERRPPEPEPEPPAPPEPEPEPEPVLPSPTPAPPDRAPRPERREAQPAPPAPRSAAGTPEVAQRQGSPTGSSLGTATFGVAGLDNPNFRYSYYVDQMVAMISSAWTRPPIGGEVEAIVSFRIRRDGSIDAPRIVRSSGYSSFDLAALRAVQQAAPFPHLPQTFKEDSLGVNLIVH